jgi:hypothetical protein
MIVELKDALTAHGLANGPESHSPGRTSNSAGRASRPLVDSPCRERVLRFRHVLIVPNLLSRKASVRI